ncbi:stage V sporulation protein AB [Konateibacter massiliensis]|uniref:stage V sporulation protein AB n=1 Tax=Konateibacter massiliensis TaxID=2002841 RepID=UPI000C15893F|nr:stage V sporulation protein AB [Konateibacter massiliensis]
MWIKQCILILVGLGSGIAVSAGTFAAIAGIGVIPRFADRTHTAKRILWYENSAILGGIIGNVIYLYHISLPGNVVTLVLYGGFSGIFVGCMVMALAEILNVIPIFTRRVKMKWGLSLIILFIAMGKILGAALQFIIS